MKKHMITAFLTLLVLLFHGSPSDSAARGKIIMHFFSSGVCPVCKQAEGDMPSLEKQYPGLTIIKYEVRNGQGIITPHNNQNIQKLITMLSTIDKSLKGEPFIYEGTKAWPFILEKGVPCYRKKISESTTLTKEIPVPVFILGNRVFLGYQRHLLQRELTRLSTSQ